MRRNLQVLVVGRATVQDLGEEPQTAYALLTKGKLFFLGGLINRSNLYPSSGAYWRSDILPTRKLIT